MNKIYINQIGYRPNDAKKAVIPQDCLEFYVIRASDEVAVFCGKASGLITDNASAQTVRVADFSEVKNTGEYILCAGDNRSCPIMISENPYKELRTAVLEMFNYQKCGVDLKCGAWSHPACHTKLAAVFGTNEKKDVAGGWHDAGDYGRYIVPAAKAVADLLLAYELSSIKDVSLLDIVWFEIEWMLKMQDETTGGVFHKVSCKKFNALDEMPHEELDDLYLSPVSATATADFSATMALASRFYPGKKDALLKAAKRAWEWCEANPNAKGFENPDGVYTGEYGDDNSMDERIWAACELFSATKEETYHDYIKSQIDANPFASNDRRLLSGLGWNMMGTYAVIAYLSQTGEKSDDKIVSRMKKELLTDCEAIIDRYKSSPYGISLGETYVWGSNMTVANNAMALLLGNIFGTDDSVKKTQYIEASLEHFHYLLGRNPLSQSYITGFGANPARNPHHRPSVAVGKTVPGMVVGGPCANVTRDPAINEFCASAPPAKRYIDHKDSFASNEVTIYWNSPVYFIVAII